MQALSAQAGGWQLGGPDNVVRSEAIEAAGNDDSSGPTTGTNALGVATAGGALTLYRGTGGNPEGRSNLLSTMLQCWHLIPSKHVSKPVTLNH